MTECSNMPSDPDDVFVVREFVEFYAQLIADPVTAAVLVDAALAHDEAQERHRGWRWLFDPPIEGHGDCICCPHSNALENDPLLDGLERIATWPDYVDGSARLELTRMCLRAIVANGYRVAFTDGRPVLAVRADHSHRSAKRALRRRHKGRRPWSSGSHRND